MIDPSIDRSSERSIDRSSKRSIDGSIDRAIDRSSARSIDCAIQHTALDRATTLECVPLSSTPRWIEGPCPLSSTPRWIERDDSDPTPSCPARSVASSLGILFRGWPCDKSRGVKRKEERISRARLSVNHKKGSAAGAPRRMQLDPGRLLTQREPYAQRSREAHPYEPESVR